MNISRLKNQYTAKKLIFITITLIAIIARLSISFSTDLIMGIDGGYYPLQVRNILNTGFFAFNDLPLYFYFCALLLKLISFVGFAITNENIILVIKIIDCVALPLLIIPLLKIISKNESKIPFFSELAIVLFTLFSFSPFIMLGDLQKNAFAIPFLLIFIHFIENYFIANKKRDIIFALLSMITIAITHFGVFVFSLAFLLVMLYIVYRKKAIFPSILLFFIGFSIILLFDSNRAIRLITFWNVIFEKSTMFNEPLPPPVLLNIMLSYFLVVFAIFQYNKYKEIYDKATKNMVLVLTVLILIFAFPLYETQYVLRFNALLFIPQGLLILYLIRINKKIAVRFSILLFSLTVFSTFAYFTERRSACIDELAFHDLQNIKPFISENKESTIIITRHGIEFWTAWALHVKVGNDRSMDKLNLDNYTKVLFLQPKEEPNKIHNKKKPFDEPTIPKNSQLVYSSLYFNMYQIK